MALFESNGYARTLFDCHLYGLLKETAMSVDRLIRKPTKGSLVEGLSELSV